MNELQIYENAELGSVRTTIINSEPYFVGKDVADILGYSNSTKAILNHVDLEDRDAFPIRDSIGRMQKTITINESGLYSLILSSKMPKAKEFKHWVTSEILPSIRKHGAYMTSETLEKVMNDPDSWIKMLTALKNTREQTEKLKLEVKEQAPKVLFANAVSTSNQTILIGELAKLLKQNGVNTGQQRLFKWLRDNGYLIKRKGTDYNAPTQRAMELGLFKVKETVITHSDGHIVVNKTTKVTGKGQEYFINKFLDKENT